MATSRKRVPKPIMVLLSVFIVERLFYTQLGPQKLGIVNIKLISTEAKSGEMHYPFGICPVKNRPVSEYFGESKKNNRTTSCQNMVRAAITSVIRVAYEQYVCGLSSRNDFVFERC